ncbi:TetR/AcrR family transcriptional regulator [Atopomonas sediminilitoris]|uniref:TetR/AcrR family transcriptional regulator n=1 Tax=Atopomonas sediminilitoris TaxID=2919919 RepID=UPI001F4E5158|nr:TetR/AcrR family transcriptional regulator [Atopomonas sediminilitoris]MCJ8169674.1 TetR/AcrR family transcriptional regulator [Atopomonas sediminilitoris]
MSFHDQQFEQRQQAILRAALALFRTKSWDRVTIAEVAVEAGIGKGTVYKHFPSKEALYAQLVIDDSLANIAEFRALHASLPKREAMRTVTRHAFAKLLDDPVMAQLFMHCDRPDFQERLAPEYRSQFDQLEHHYLAFFTDMLSDALGGPALSVEDYERLLWSADACFTGAMARVAAGGIGHLCGRTEMDAYLDQVTDFIMAGLHGMADMMLQAKAEGACKSC